MFKKSKALVVDNGRNSEAQVFVEMSYENHLALVTAEADQSFKKAYKRVEKIVKRKSRQYLREKKPSRLYEILAYTGNNFVLPVALGAGLGAIAGVILDFGAYLEMIQTFTIGDISSLYKMAIQGAVSVAVVRSAIEIIKLPWKASGLGQENHPNKLINLINGFIEFVPRIIVKLSPDEKKERVEDYFEVLEHNPTSRGLMNDPETKARLYVLYSLQNHQPEKPKLSNYKLLHAIKGAAKYAFVAGILNTFNPLEATFPIRTSIAALAGAVSEFVYKRQEEIAFKTAIRQKNADYKTMTKKMEDDAKDQLIGCLVNRWYGGQTAAVPKEGIEE